MNIMYAELQHVFFLEHRVERFENQIDACNTSIWSKGNILYVEITGNKDEEDLRGLMFEIFSLFFLYLGGYPRINKIEFNGLGIDISKFVGKYVTWEYFLKKDLAVCKIDKNSITEKIIHTYRKLKLLPIYSLEYLVSDNYQKVITNHKITLLLHVIDGIISNKEAKLIESEFIEKFNFNDKLGDYRLKVYLLCKNYFFNYNEKYETNILQLLNIDDYKFINILVDTRHWYSHFLENNEKRNKLKNGAEMIIFFEIIAYVIRLYLVDKIGANFVEDFVQEYYYTVHDWILKLKYDKDEPLKSKTYKISKEFAKIYTMIEEYLKKSDENI